MRSNEQGRALGRSSRYLGDTAEFEMLVCAVDVPKRPQVFHLLDKAAQILVDHNIHPAISKVRINLPRRQITFVHHVTS